MGRGLVFLGKTGTTTRPIVDAPSRAASRIATPRLNNQRINDLQSRVTAIEAAPPGANPQFIAVIADNRINERVLPLIKGRDANAIRGAAAQTGSTSVSIQNQYAAIPPKFNAVINRAGQTINKTENLLILMRQFVPLFPGAVAEWGNNPLTSISTGIDVLNLVTQMMDRLMNMMEDFKDFMSELRGNFEDIKQMAGLGASTNANIGNMTSVFKDRL